MTTQRNTFTKIQGPYSDFVSRDGVRFYEVDDKGRVLYGPCDERTARAQIAGDEADAMAEAKAEMQAEFGMSYVCGGGRAEDVAQAWAMHGENWNGVEIR